MTCPSELELSMHSDGALDHDAAAALQTHLAGCPACRDRLHALQAESRLLTAALARPDPVDVPAFTLPVSPAGLAGASVLVVLAASLVAFGSAVVVPALPEPLSWFNPINAASLMDLAIGAVVFLFNEGARVAAALMKAAAIAVFAGAAAWVVLSLRRRPPGGMVLLSLLCVAVMVPLPSQAFDIRHAENGRVYIPADMVIEDTLIAVGETVEVDGTVEGDLIAFGRRVVVRGRVGGMVFTGAQTVTVEGEVQGSLIGFGRSVDFTSARIGRDLYGFGATVESREPTSVVGNALAGGERVSLSGPVGKDLIGFAQEIEVSNTVGGKLTAYANRVTLLAPARIEGNVTVHVPQEDHLTVSPSAVIGGELSTEVREFEEQESPYGTVGFYVGQVLRYAAAFLMGTILLLLIPNLRRASLDSVAEALIAGGVGLVALVATPIIAIIIAFTIIGIPLTLLALFLWLVGLYFAKVIFAHYLGSRLLGASVEPRQVMAALAVGLALVIFAVNLPFVGGLLNFLMTIAGLGLLVLFGWRAFRGDRSAGAAV